MIIFNKNLGTVPKAYKAKLIEFSEDPSIMHTNKDGFKVYPRILQ